VAAARVAIQAILLAAVIQAARVAAEILLHHRR